MKLLLAFLLVMVAIGLFSDRLDRRVYTLVAVVAFSTTLLYFAARRFMS